VKDAYIYDGSGWQSLKGPPGPSEPSKDAGNNLTVGSDGLLMLKGDTQFSGVWTPVFNGTFEADGYWTRAGRAVTLTITFGTDNRDEGDAPIYYGFSGLPFSIAEFYDANLSAQSAAFAAPVMSVEPAEGVIGLASMIGVAGGEAIAAVIDKKTDSGRACINITYLTDDARLG
jgi:hypothetical protein